MWQDIRVTIRSWRKSPAFALTAVVTLTLAIGANATIFALLNALVLRDAAVRDPRSLVNVASVNPQSGLEGGMTYALYREIAARQQVFSSVIGWRSNGVQNITVEGQLTRGVVAAVNGAFFDELGARPVAGRLLTAGDLREPSEDPAMLAVLGHALWQRAFNADPNVVGRRVVVEDIAFTVVGVAPPDFIGLGMFVEPDLTVPLTAWPKFATFANAALRSGTSNWVRVTGRLKRGVALEQARAAMELLWPDVKAANVPPSLQGARRDAFLAAGISVQSAAKGIEPGPGMRARFTQPLYVLLAIALIVLLIACLNLASLMVARGVAATHDIGVRLALGASRLRVMRGVIVEGILLAGAGAVAGVLIALWASDALATSILRDYSVRATLDVTPDARVIAFVAIIAIAGGALFSGLAAWRSGRQDVTAWLRRSPRTVSRDGRAGRWLIAGQVALSLILLVNSGLLIRSLQQVRAVSSGMDPRGVVVAYSTELPGGYRTVDNDTYFPEVIARLERIPGVQRAAISNFKPAGGGIGGGEPVSAVDSAADAAGFRATFMSISPQTFAALGMTLTAGRDFSWADHSRARRVAIVSSTLARHLFPAGSAIGQRIRIGVQPRRQDLEVIGVVADAHIYDLKDANLAGVYVAALQEPDLVDGKCFIIRGSGVGLEAIRAAVTPFGYEVVTSSESLEYIVERVLLRDRLLAMFAAFFGGVALLLAAVGLYGLMSFEVGQRVREIAIRVALGADRTRVARTVVGDGLAVTSAGLIGGSLAAMASVDIVESLVFGVAPRDPVTLIAAAALLAAIALVACLLPAMRAATAEPMEILRAS